AGLAGGVGLALVAARAPRLRWPLTVAAGLLLAASLVYPVSGPMTRLQEGPVGGPTLAGSGFLPPGEAAAVRWLRGQAGQGGDRPVLAEAVGGAYSAAGRMATYSGAAAVLGWVNHEMQWR